MSPAPASWSATHRLALAHPRPPSARFVADHERELDERGIHADDHRPPRRSTPAAAAAQDRLHRVAPGHERADLERPVRPGGDGRLRRPQTRQRLLLTEDIEGDDDADLRHWNPRAPD